MLETQRLGSPLRGRFAPNKALHFESLTQVKLFTCFFPKKKPGESLIMPETYGLGSPFLGDCVSRIQGRSAGVLTDRPSDFESKRKPNCWLSPPTKWLRNFGGGWTRTNGDRSRGIYSHKKTTFHSHSQLATN